MRLAWLVLVTLCGACYVPLRSADATLFYDARGRLGWCSDGAIHVESTNGGTPETVVGSEWSVRDATPLPDGRGYVVRSRRDAPTYGWFPTMADETTELWLFEPGHGEPRRLTRNLAHESSVTALPDSSGVVFLEQPASNGWSMLAPHKTLRCLDFTETNLAPLPFVREPLAPLSDGRLAVIAASGPKNRERSNAFLDLATGELEVVDASTTWSTIDRSGRTVAWDDCDNEPPRRFVHWRDRESGEELVFRVGQDLRDYEISPDGQRIAIATRGGWALSLLIVATGWWRVTVREYDRTGALLREVEL